MATSSTAKAALKAAPSKLSQALARLNTKPKLSLPDAKSLKLTYAYRNDHFGARHFAKEDLPRIRWANPNLEIQVERALKTPEEQWKPELEVQFQDGKSQVFSIQDKFSSAILRELMDAAGGEPWQAYKAEAIASGKPVIPGEELGVPLKRSKAAAAKKADLPNLERFRELNPPKPKEKSPAPLAAATPIPDPTLSESTTASAPAS